MQSQHQSQLTDYQGSLFRRFTGKEKDSESGYYYFGARYFMPTLSIWNSVDPMADKYPSLSPYNYCAWNPMKLVDPNGMEVYITGDAAEQALKQLSSKRITVTRDEETGKLMVKINARRLTYGEKILVKAINDKNIKVNIYATNDNEYDFHGFAMNNSQKTGQFLGTDVGDCDKNGVIRTASTQQLVNPNVCDQRDKEYDAPTGTSLRHEITESFIAGVLSVEKGISVGPSYDYVNGKPVNIQNEVYNKAHSNASFQARDRANHIQDKMKSINAIHKYQ
jgi:RHS repeat-associated protein